MVFHDIMKGALINTKPMSFHVTHVQTLIEKQRKADLKKNINNLPEQVQKEAEKLQEKWNKQIGKWKDKWGGEKPGKGHGKEN
jgi:esterase/lipase superfamily enzyme